MKVTYKREDHRSYLVILQDRKELTEEEDFSMTMLMRNPFVGLLRPEEKVFNGEISIYYDISGKQSLSVLYERKLFDGEALRKLLIDLKEVYKNLSGYLADTEGIILDPEYIFLDTNQGKFYFLYYPQTETEDRAGDFSEYLLDRIEDKDENAVMQAYEFYRLVKEEDGDVSAAVMRMDTESEIPLRMGREDCEVKVGSDREEISDNEFYLDDPPGEMKSIDEHEDIGDETAGENDEKKSMFFRKTGISIKALAAFSVMAVAGAGLMLWCAYNENAAPEELVSIREFAIGAGLVLAALVGVAALLLSGKRKDHGKKGGSIKKEYMKEPEEISSKKGADVPDWWEDEAEVDLSEDDVRIPNAFEHKTEVDPDEEDDLKTMLIDENIYREQRILSGKIKGKTREIDLAQFPFIVGKNRENVDLYIDDRSVSRMHARFTLRDDMVFLTDLNSLNGTYKNGIRLEPNELVALEREDEIRFGRCSFVYL